MNEIVFKAAISRLVVIVDRRTGAVCRLADTQRPQTMLHYNAQTQALFVVDPKDVALKVAG